MVFEKVREKLAKRAKARHDKLLKQDIADIEKTKEEYKLWKSAEGVEKERLKVHKIKSNIGRMKEKTGGGGFIGKLMSGGQKLAKGYGEVSKAIEPFARGIDEVSGSFGLGSPTPRRSPRKRKGKKSKKKGRRSRSASDGFDFGF